MEHKDRPRAEIIPLAQAVIDRAAGRAKVYFKVSCPICGERLTLQPENVLPDIADCTKCDIPFVIEKAGYMILLSMPAAVQSKEEDIKSGTESISR